jgi:hypothetical protein
MFFKRRLDTLALIALVFTASLLPLFLFSARVKASVLYDSGNPTPEQQLVLEVINRARSNPIAEGQRLGIDIHEGLPDSTLVGPRPPLAMNKILLSIAQAHTQDMYRLNYFSHNDPDGTTPYGRMINAGYAYVRAGENMAAGTYASATELEDFMMMDSGTPERPHRINLLDLINPYPCDNSPCVYYEVGLGYYEGPTMTSYGNSFITEDFGTRSNSGPLLLGVVYNDMNRNNFYDIGEGIAGVTITTSSGTYYAISSSSGGYAIPIGTSGTITITASSSGFGPVTKTVTLTGANVKVDFTSQDTVTTTQTGITTETTTTSSTTTASQTSTTPATTPSITLDPSVASAGMTVAVQGSGFRGTDTLCGLTGGAVALSPPPTCYIFNGILTGSFVIASVTSGVYAITATGYASGGSTTAYLQVTAISASVTINPTSAHLGALIRVEGSGFSTADTSCAYSSGFFMLSPTCSISSGTLTGSFVAANAAPSSYTITVTGHPIGDSASTLLVLLAPAIVLTPTSVPPGSAISVAGSGFYVADSTCSFTGTAVADQTCSISGGALTGSFTVASVPAGSYSITVATNGADSGVAAASFQVSANPRSITVNPVYGMPGTSVQAFGSGFSTTDNACSLSGSPVSNSTCSISSGVLTATFTVANIAAGAYVITATGTPEGDVAVTAFTVTPLLTQTTSSTSSSTTSSTTPTTSTTSSPPTTTTSSIESSTTSTTSSSATTVPVPQCLIATATYGTPLAPEVQLLRNFRDNSLMNTKAGSSFMIAFNSLYYSFSPTVASYLQEHWVERKAMKGALYPLIGILWLTSVTFNEFGSYPEMATLISGLLASSLIGATYIGLPLALLEARIPRLADSRKQKMIVARLIIMLFASLLALGLGELYLIVPLLILSASAIVLSTMFLAGTKTANMFANMLRRTNQHQLNTLVMPERKPAV